MPAAHAPLASLLVSALSSGGMANLDDMDMDDMLMMGGGKGKISPHEDHGNKEDEDYILSPSVHCKFTDETMTNYALKVLTLLSEIKWSTLTPNTVFWLCLTPFCCG